MPSPSTSIATRRSDLGGSFEEFDVLMANQGFIATKCLPMLEAAVQAGTFGKIPVEQMLQKATTNRSPGAGYNRGNWTFTSDTFATVEHGWEEPIDDREAAMWGDFLNAEELSTARALGIVLRAAEERTADLLFNATTFSAAVSAVNWATTASSTPIADIETAVRAVWARTGIWPDTLVLGRHAFRNLRLTTQIIDRIAASGAGDRNRATDVTSAHLSGVFDLPKIFVAGSAENSANEGQTASIGSIWSQTYAMVMKTADTDDIREPCIGRTIRWNEPTDGGSIFIDGSHPVNVETYRDETVRGNVARVRHDVHEKLIYTEIAELIDITGP